jgi:aspartate aminotransferase
MLKARLDSAMEILSTIDGVRAIKPDGAFYIWLDVKGLIGRKFENKQITSSRDLALIFLEKFFVATVPGEEFGSEGFIRLSYAIDTPRMQEALNRLKKLISQLS